MSLGLLPERTVSSVVASPSSVAAVAPVGLLVSSGVVHVPSSVVHVPFRSSVLNIDHGIIFVGESRVLVRVVVRLHVAAVRVEARDVAVVAIESLRRVVPDVGWGVGVTHHRAAFVEIVGVPVIVHRPSVLRVLLVKVTLALVVEISLSLISWALVVEVPLPLISRALVERVPLALPVAVVVVVLVVVLLIWLTVYLGWLSVPLLAVIHPVVIHVALVHRLVHLVLTLAVLLVVVHWRLLLATHHDPCDDRSQNCSDTDGDEQPRPPRQA